MEQMEEENGAHENGNGASGSPDKDPAAEPTGTVSMSLDDEVLREYLPDNPKGRNKSKRRSVEVP